MFPTISTIAHIIERSKQLTRFSNHLTLNGYLSTIIGFLCFLTTHGVWFETKDIDIPWHTHEESVATLQHWELITTSVGRCHTWPWEFQAR